MASSPGMDYEGRLYFLRDTTRDRTFYDNPPTVYTDNTSLTVGQTLYDNTGSDTGLIVSMINQDGSFAAGTSPVEIWGYKLNSDIDCYITSDFTQSPVVWTTDLINIISIHDSDNVLEFPIIFKMVFSDSSNNCSCYFANDTYIGTAVFDRSTNTFTDMDIGMSDPSWWLELVDPTA